jgi:hypothetical protein
VRVWEVPEAVRKTKPPTPVRTPNAQTSNVSRWGTIKGKVTYDGDVPEPQFIHKAGDSNVKDAATCAKYDMPSEEWVVNEANKGVRWVLVYVDKPEAIHDDLKDPSGEVELGQEFCQFKPHLLAYRAGQKLKITSSDPIGHNVNMTPFRGESINPLMPAAEPGKKTIFEAPDWKAQNRPFPAKCNVHGWMIAHIMIFDHPYFAVTDENGEFEIKNVPTGKVRLRSWHEAVGDGEGGRDGKEIDVTSDGATQVNLKFRRK